MAKKRRKSRRRRANKSYRRRRRSTRISRRNPLMLFGAPKRRRHHKRHRKIGRRRLRNPSEIATLTSGSMLSMVGGGAVGFFGARMIPQSVPFLSGYNVGMMGYGLNIVTGLGLSWLLKKFWNKQAGTGALIGTGVAVIARFVTDQMGAATPSSQANATAAVSGMGADLDFDLGYYIEQFPLAQGASAGPYGYPVGTPYNSLPMVNTNASAVRAGQTAAQAALPAGGAGAASPAPWGGGESSW